MSLNNNIMNKQNKLIDMEREHAGGCQTGVGGGKGKGAGSADWQSGNSLGQDVQRRKRESMVL